ncbi:MAG: DUF3842 family protein [Spirochaetales bacterium]|jgi:hypothetical protein|nr:DUF3842 family protein [Spirochaetales bacterium]
MKIMVLDGQGGGMGKILVGSIRATFPNIEILAVGTNSSATYQMLKAGADNSATGENAVIVGARKSDIIIGPIGMVIADSLYGEITPAMALAISQSKAKRILIPVNHCDNLVAGISDLSMNKLIESAIELIRDNLT